MNTEYEFSVGVLKIAATLAAASLSEGQKGSTEAITTAFQELIPVVKEQLLDFSRQNP